MTIVSDQNQFFGYFYKGFGFDSEHKSLPQKLQKTQKLKFQRKNQEQYEPYPPEDKSDFLETDSDPEMD